MTRPPKTPRLGSRIGDRKSERGTVVHIYRQPEIRDEIIGVLFDEQAVPLAVPIDSIRKLNRRRNAP